MSISEKYLPLYLGEFELRHNLRRAPDLMIRAVLLPLFLLGFDAIGS